MDHHMYQYIHMYVHTQPCRAAADKELKSGPCSHEYFVLFLVTWERSTDYILRTMIIPRFSMFALSV